MEERQPIAWLDTVTTEESSEPVRVVLHDRQGSTVIVRQVDPGEDACGRVPMFEGDQVVVMIAYSHAGIHAFEESNDNSDLVHSVRIVPLRREGNIVYARTLRLDEEDDGRRVHVAPGEQIRFEGTLVVELEAIDALEEETESGYKPIASVLNTWFSIGRDRWDESAVRYLLAAARRLDIANELFIRVRETEDEVNAGSA